MSASAARRSGDGGLAATDTRTADARRRSAGRKEQAPRLELVVRSWISLAESTALIWLDGRRIPREELETQLVHDSVALAAVSAAYDREMTGIVLRVLSQEPADGPFGDLVARLSALAPDTPAQRLSPRTPP